MVAKPRQVAIAEEQEADVQEKLGCILLAEFVVSGPETLSGIVCMPHYYGTQHGFILFLGDLHTGCFPLGFPLYQPKG